MWRRPEAALRRACPAAVARFSNWQLQGPPEKCFPTFTPYMPGRGGPHNLLRRSALAQGHPPLPALSQPVARAPTPQAALSSPVLSINLGSVAHMHQRMQHAWGVEETGCTTVRGHLGPLLPGACRSVQRLLRRCWATTCRRAAQEPPSGVLSGVLNSVQLSRAFLGVSYPGGAAPLLLRAARRRRPSGGQRLPARTITSPALGRAPLPVFGLLCGPKQGWEGLHCASGEQNCKFLQMEWWQQAAYAKSHRSQIESGCSRYITGQQ